MVVLEKDFLVVSRYKPMTKDRQLDMLEFMNPNSLTQDVLKEYNKHNDRKKYLKDFKPKKIIELDKEVIHSSIL